MTPQFRALTAFLERTRPLWGPRPFTADPPWVADETPLVDWLLARTDDEVELVEPDLARGRTWLHPRLAALLDEAEQVSALPELPSCVTPPAGETRRGIQARKWRQLRAFLSHLSSPPEGRAFVDWCAGKGHLGRTYGVLHQVAGLALEIDPAMADQGAELAKRDGVEMSYQVVDVLTDSLDPREASGRTILALHACGSLGDRALEVAVQHAASLAWAPCCFHRRRDGFEPWSSLGRASTFRPGKEDLRLPTTDEVIADTRVRRRRRTAMGYRLGLQHLREVATGDPSYRSIPSVPDTWLAQGFEAFCRQVADRHQVPLPEQVAWDSAERIGWERMARARRLGLVRAAIRRPLEVWLDLDRALWLEEEGMDVRVGTFCARTITPRNVLVHARRRTS